MDALTAEEVSPDSPAVLPLIERHLELMRASSPACSVHAMTAGSLAEAGARFFAIFDAGEAIAIGALKPLSEAHGEVKSMHVRADRRGGGLADAILARLIAAACEAGMTRLSLETGSQAVFAGARAFYARHGFEPCAAYEGYAEDPNSVFMTRSV